MRFALIILTIASLAVVGYASIRIRELHAAPNVQVVGGDIFDAGIVGGTQAVTHTFHIVNPHRFPIGLSAPEAGCSCTTATASTSVIPANGSSDVTLKVDPEDGNLSGSASIVTTHGDQHVSTWLFVSGRFKK